MNKEQIISFIKTQISAGLISKEDVLGIVGVAQAPVSTVSTPVVLPIPDEHSSKGLVSIFYAIGAIIVLIGIIILIVQHWDDIGTVGRILVTAGIALTTYISGILLRDYAQKHISSILLVISAALAPLSSYVLFHEAGISFDLNHQIIVSLALVTLFAVAQWIARKEILVMLITGFGTWSYYTILARILIDTQTNGDWLKWATMFLGFAYLLIAYSYSKNSQNNNLESGQAERIAVGNVLYGLGTLAVLGSGISIGGVWDLIFILFIFGAFYGSVFLKSRSMLMLVALFLVGHIFKLTGKYFAGSISWPIALVVGGFVIIGIGYATLQINKKYISVQ